MLYKYVTIVYININIYINMLLLLLELSRTLLPDILWVVLHSVADILRLYPQLCVRTSVGPTISKM